MNSTFEFGPLIHGSSFLKITIYGDSALTLLHQVFKEITHRFIWSIILIWNIAGQAFFDLKINLLSNSWTPRFLIENRHWLNWLNTPNTIITINFLIFTKLENIQIMAIAMLRKYERVARSYFCISTFILWQHLNFGSRSLNKHCRHFVIYI